MSNIAYHLVEGDRVKNVVALFPDQAEPIKSADSNHPHWQAILQGLRNGDADTYKLFDVRGGLGYKLKSLSERIDYDGENVRFDGDIVNNALAAQVIRFLEQGVSDWEPLVKFWEKIAQNPDAHSQENLYRWLQTHEFSITAEGDIVGYKGVQLGRDADGNEQFQSIHAGPAVVDGLAVNGHVPNTPGSVVTMPRAKVQHDPAVGCHTGLHVGTWGYASGFGPVVLEVHVNPRDVVSVPTDCGDAKMRVSKYTVVQKIGKAYSDAVLTPAEDYGWQGDVGYEVPDWAFKY